MGWEWRKYEKRVYGPYFVDRREGARQYFGRHPPCTYVAAEHQRRAEQAHLREAHKQQQALEQQITQFCRLVELLAAGYLVARGYYHHHREPLWRKRRGYRPITEPFSREEKSMTGNLGNKTLDEVSQELQQLVQRGEAGKQDALLALHAFIQQPAILTNIGTLGKHVASQLTYYMASGDPSVQAGLLAHFEQIKTALVGADASPIEHLLVEEIALCLLQARHADTIDARHTTLEQQQKRQDRAHKRYLNALRTLAQVGRLLQGRPTVQVNVAQNQINVG